ncbi:MAG: proteasome assembly chaperone family protein [Promethearchaeota archaeon]
MNKSFIKYIEKPILKEPILIVGLPGVGNIGKLAAGYLIKELPAKKFGIIYSPHFPYHVVISNEGVIRLLNNEFHYYISKKEINDLIILCGDYQSQTLFGQYEVAGVIINLCKKFNVGKIITMGGYAIGSFKDKTKVFGAINNSGLDSWMKELAVEQCDIGSPIVGAAGLLLGLAKLNNINAICLLGETPGFITDAKAAKTILIKILSFLKLEVDLSKLDETDQKIKETVDKIHDFEKQKGMIKKLKEKFATGKKDLSYFG